LCDSLDRIGPGLDILRHRSDLVEARMLGALFSQT